MESYLVYVREKELGFNKKEYITIRVLLLNNNLGRGRIPYFAEEAYLTSCAQAEILLN